MAINNPKSYLDPRDYSAETIRKGEELYNLYNKLEEEEKARNKQPQTNADQNGPSAETIRKGEELYNLYNKLQEEEKARNTTPQSNMIQRFASEYPRVANALASKSDTITKLAYNPFTESVLGAGDAARNSYANLMNVALDAGIPISYAEQNPELRKSTPYQIGAFIGNVLPFIQAGQVAGPLVRGAPGVSPTAQRLLGSAVYGATQSPENRVGGALIGGAAAGVAEGIPALYKSISPNIKMNDIIGKILATSKDAERISTEAYNDIFNTVGEHIPSYFKEPGASVNFIKNIEKDVAENYSSPGGEFKKIIDQFKVSPTLANAQGLRSEAGRELSKLTTKNIFEPLDSAERNDLLFFKQLRDNLGESLDTSFKDLSTPENNLFEKWTNAQKYFKDVVAPKRELVNLAARAKGTGTTQNALGTFEKAQGKAITQQTIAEARGLPRKELPISDELQKSLQNVKTRALINDLIKRSAGAAVGATLPGVGPLLGGLGGFAASPAIMKSLEQYIPGGGAEFLKNLLSKGKTAIIPNIPFTQQLTRDINNDNNI